MSHGTSARAPQLTPSVRDILVHFCRLPRHELWQADPNGFGVLHRGLSAVCPLSFSWYGTLMALGEAHVLLVSLSFDT